MKSFIGESCDLRDLPPLPETPMPAMAYVPFQQFSTVYPPEQGFEAGTLFPELNKPFWGKRGSIK